MLRNLQRGYTRKELGINLFKVGQLTLHPDILGRPWTGSGSATRLDAACLIWDRANGFILLAHVSTAGPGRSLMI